VLHGEKPSKVMLLTTTPQSRCFSCWWKS